MKKSKMIVATVLACALLLTLLAGCSVGTPASSSTAPSTAASAASVTDKEVTLTFWTPTWRQGAEEGLIADFMKQHPNIKIETTFMSSSDIQANIKIAASSGTLPDMWFNWGGVGSDFFAENKLCLDLTEYAAANDWENKYLAGALEKCKYEGQLLGLPQNLVGLVMYYRTDIFKKYNLEVPKTMEELEIVCETLLANGITPFSTFGGEHMMRYSEALLEHYAGPEEHDKLLTLEGDWSKSEGLTKAFAKMKEWSDKKYFPDGVLTNDTAVAATYVYSGASAMIMENPGMASQIVANGDDTSLYAWFPFPCGTSAENTGRVSAYAKICQFNADITEEKLAAAMLFWDYYFSDESLAAHEAIEHPTAKIGAVLPEKLKLAEGMLELINENGGYSTMGLKVPAEIMAQYYAMQDSVVLGETKPEDAGAQIQAAVETYKANQ